MITVNVFNCERYAGVTYRKLDHWTRKGYLKPIGGFQGSGHPREWTSQELSIARTMGVLTAAGLHLEVAAKLARQLHETQTSRLLVAPGIYIELFINDFGRASATTQLDSQDAGERTGEPQPHDLPDGEGS